VPRAVPTALAAPKTRCGHWLRWPASFQSFLMICFIAIIALGVNHLDRGGVKWPLRLEPLKGEHGASLASVHRPETGPDQDDRTLRTDGARAACANFGPIRPVSTNSRCLSVLVTSLCCYYSNGLAPIVSSRLVIRLQKLDENQPSPRPVAF
jgi:hypothetical protein